MMQKVIANEVEVTTKLLDLRNSGCQDVDKDLDLIAKVKVKLKMKHAIKIFKELKMLLCLYR